VPPWRKIALARVERSRVRGLVLVEIELGAPRARSTGRGRVQTSGTTSFAVTGHDDAEGLALQPDCKIIVAGTSGTGEFALARLTPDGRLDPSFGN
jgi:hypothetical protein